MSVLETPRIYFRGQISWDPIVTNNTADFYDEVTSETVFANVADKVADFRERAIDAVALPVGNWNPHGTHRSTFYDTAISGADTGRKETREPFVGSPVSLTGMLVDLEPYGSLSSQLFFDSMSFGIAGGYRINARRRTRMTARYINFKRNRVGYRAGIGSAIWQTCFPKGDGLSIDAFDSPALLALQKALASDDVLGLKVEWNAYATVYFDDPLLTKAQTEKLNELSAELIAKLRGGGFQPNPAPSMLVGVIGLWRAGEPLHEPLDRVLAGAQSKTPATAFARIEGRRLVLDLSNSISEVDRSLEKQKLGELTVVAVDPSTNDVTKIASFGEDAYDKAAYERTSGIVTLDIEHAPPKKTDLQLRDASGNVLLAEPSLRAVPLVPNLYMNQADARTAEFQIYERGVAVGAGVSVTIAVVSADGQTIESTFVVTTDARGIASFPVVGVQGGILAYLALPGPDPALPAAIDPQAHGYMYVRTLPADEETAQLPPTWENVYQHVLANWHAMAPCMDNWLDLGNEAQVSSLRNVIRKLTDQASFENYRYMPVTRDLTRGQRKLLYNYLALVDAREKAAQQPAVTMFVANDAAAAAAPSATPEATTTAEEPQTFAELNRSMRSN